MRFAVGQIVGNYEILGPLGEGAMGEVFRARDCKLGREVALKVMREEVAEDADRLARFRREAQVLASLNHPNIAILYGIDEVDGVHFLIMELVTGITLSEKLAFGPMITRDIINFGSQLAEALEAAHAQGIIHRDLKPSNIKLTPQGRIKVLDFGLAKPTLATDSSLTIESQLKGERHGLIMGTPAYMSPEQAEGRTVDRRADVWAFGCVLYEMVTGRRAFEASSALTTLALVLHSDPDWQKLPQATHARIRELLQRCLQKNQDRRLGDMGEVRIALQDLAREGSPQGQPVAGLSLSSGATAAIPAAKRAAAAADPNATITLEQEDAQTAEPCPPTVLSAPPPAVAAASPRRSPLGLVLLVIIVAGLTAGAYLIFAYGKPRESLAVLPFVVNLNRPVPRAAADALATECSRLLGKESAVQLLPVESLVGRHDLLVGTLQEIGVRLDVHWVLAGTVIDDPSNEKLVVQVQAVDVLTGQVPWRRTYSWNYSGGDDAALNRWTLETAQHVASNVRACLHDPAAGTPSKGGIPGLRDDRGGVPD